MKSNLFLSLFLCITAPVLASNQDSLLINTTKEGITLEKPQKTTFNPQIKFGDFANARLKETITAAVTEFNPDLQAKNENFMVLGLVDNLNPCLEKFCIEFWNNENRHQNPETSFTVITRKDRKAEAKDIIRFDLPHEISAEDLAAILKETIE